MPTNALTQSFKIKDIHGWLITSNQVLATVIFQSFLPCLVNKTKLREVFQCFVTLFINGLTGKSHCLILIIKGNIRI